MTAEDVPQVVDLINFYYQEYAFFCTTNHRCLSKQDKRKKGKGMDLATSKSYKKRIESLHVPDCGTAPRSSE